MTATIPRPLQAAAARGRLMLWCGAFVLLLQLFSLVGHDHDTEVKTQDCVACSVQAQSHAAPPGAAAATEGLVWLLVRELPLRDAPAAYPVRASYLFPQPHAPPAAPFFA